MTIAPVLANLGPIEDLSFKPNPGEVKLSDFIHSISAVSTRVDDCCGGDHVFIKSCFTLFVSCRFLINTLF